VAVDAGSHYAPGFFPRLFASAAARLLPSGRLVLLFSNLGQITGLAPVSPVATELESGQRFRLVDCREQPAAPATGERVPDWQRQLRQQERLQLWELERC
jgi:hypothetical protein